MHRNKGWKIFFQPLFDLQINMRHAHLTHDDKNATKNICKSLV